MKNKKKTEPRGFGSLRKHPFEERGETDAFAGYLKLAKRTRVHILLCTPKTDQSQSMCKLRDEIRHLPFALHCIF